MRLHTRWMRLQARGTVYSIKMSIIKTESFTSFVYFILQYLSDGAVRNLAGQHLKQFREGHSGSSIVNVAVQNKILKGVASQRTIIHLIVTS